MTNEELDAFLIRAARFRDALFDELDRMRAGEPNNASAIAREAIQALRRIKRREILKASKS